MTAQMQSILDKQQILAPQIMQVTLLEDAGRGGSGTSGVPTPEEPEIKEILIPARRYWIR